MKNADRPAYPIPKNRDLANFHVNGLTKREVFAMAAMQGILSSGLVIGTTSTIIVEDSIRCADELLKQLES